MPTWWRTNPARCALPGAQFRKLAKGALVKPTVGAWCWLVLAMAGCAPQPDMVATDNDNGRHIQLRSGQVFDIVLADDYDQTGCQWRDEHGHDDAA